MYLMTMIKSGLVFEKIAKVLSIQLSRLLDYAPILEIEDTRIIEFEFFPCRKS